MMLHKSTAPNPKRLWAQRRVGRQGSVTRLTAAAACVCLVAAAGCHLVTIGDNQLVDGVGGMGGVTSAGGSGGAGGQGGDAGQGGGPECETPATCPGDDGECATRTCVGGECGVAFAAESTSCAEGDGKVCDGMGSCVACVEDSHCMLTEYCDNNVCQPRKADGNPCVGANECLSDSCADGVCCESACTGPCEACIASFTLQPDGSCEPIVAGTDPRDECNGAEVCNGCGKCEGGVPIGGALYGDADEDFALRLRVDSQDNIIHTGRFAGSIDFAGNMPLTSAGSLDAYVTKLDPSGAHLWTQVYGAPNSQYAYDAIADANGNVYLGGGVIDAPIDLGDGLFDPDSFDLFVMKHDSQGTQQWVNAFVSTSTQFTTDLATDGGGNVIATGAYLNALDAGGGNIASGGQQGPFIVKYDSNGQHLWSTTYVGVQAFPAAVVTDSVGDVYVAGRAQQFLNFGSGNITLSGYDGYIVKLSGVDGSYITHALISGAGDQRIAALAVDASDNIIAAGAIEATATVAGGASHTSAGSSDILLAKLDSALAPVWSKHFGDAALQASYDVTLDAAGNIYLGGEHQGTIDFGGCVSTVPGSESDAFVAKFDPNGDHLFDWHAGDAARQGVQSLAVQSTGTIVFSAFVFGDITIGPDMLTHQGDSDIVIGRLSP